ncbi:MAG: hypothetical protein Kow0068_20890 [Marinilabiliales bacterium]
MKKKLIIYLSLVIVFFIIILILINYKKKTMKVETIQEVFFNIKKQYGVDIAKNVEKIYRLETGHFTSQGYFQTKGAGMLAFEVNYPYGWENMRNYWGVNPEHAPTGFVTMTGCDGKQHNYLKFKGFGGFYTLAEFLKQNGNNAGRWYSLLPDQQTYYNNLIAGITTNYVT